MKASVRSKVLCVAGEDVSREMARALYVPRRGSEPVQLFEWRCQGGVSGAETKECACAAWYTRQEEEEERTL